MNSGMMARTVLGLPDSDEYETPPWFYKALDTEFGFTLDPAATVSNAKCQKFYTQAENGLEQTWGGERVFCNPPYSQVDAWVRKALASPTHCCVMLLPSRTGTDWFFLLQHNHTEIRWLRKRIQFWVNGEPAGSPRFDSLLAIWR